MRKDACDLVWPCSKQRVFEITISEPPANPDIIRGMQDVKDVEVLFHGWRDGNYIVQLDIESDADVPNAVRNLIKPHKIGWMQEGVFDPGKDTFTVTVTPHIMSNLIRVVTVGAVKENGDGTTHMKLTCKAECDVPLLGGLIEKLIVTKVLGSLKKQYGEDIRREQAAAR